MLYRIYVGPFLKGRVYLTYFKGVIERWTKIRVTEDEAKSMDKLPKQWLDPDSPMKVAVVTPTKAKDEDDIKVTKRTKKRKTRKRKGGK